MRNALFAGPSNQLKRKGSPHEFASFVGEPHATERWDGPARSAAQSADPNAVLMLKAVKRLIHAQRIFYRENDLR